MAQPTRPSESPVSRAARPGSRPRASSSRCTRSRESGVRARWRAREKTVSGSDAASTVTNRIVTSSGGSSRVLSSASAA